VFKFRPNPGRNPRSERCAYTETQNVSQVGYHRTRDSIEAHMTVVFAAMAVAHWIEHQTGWSIKKFVRTARRYRTVTIQAGRQTLTAAEAPPEALARIHGLGAH
jgi:hypothetical protein